MKAKLHPNYQEVLYRCASCKHQWVSRSTKLDGREETIDGRTYRVIPLEICSNCHPFFSGKKNFIDAAGRMEKFAKRFGAGAVVSKKKEKKEATGSAS